MTAHLPFGWKQERLDAVAELERTTVVPHEIKQGTKYVGLEHIDGSGEFLDAPEVEEGELASNKFAFTTSHILYGKLRPYLTKIARPDFSGVCSTEIVPIRANGKVIRDYLYYYLRRPQTVALAIARTGGANLPRLSPNDLAGFPICYPESTDEQRRIAGILNQADALRRKRAEAIRLAGEFVPSVFHEMFGDVISNSRGWETNRLGNVAQLDRGRSRHRPRNAPALYGGPYPFVQTGDVANSNGWIEAYSQSYSEAGLAQSKMWPAGTLCITIAANIAATAVLTFDACFPDSVVGLIPGENLMTQYVRHWFVRMQRWLENSAPQVAQKNINLEILNRQEIPVPPMNLQRQFTERLEAWRGIQQQQRQSAAELEKLFASLLHRAFRGEL